MKLVVENGQGDFGRRSVRGLHVHGRHASLSVVWWRCRFRFRPSLRYVRGWADAYVELRLWRLVMTVTWDLKEEVKHGQ